MSIDHIPDPELQRELAALALAGLDGLLSGLPPASSIAAAEIGAIVRLIVQAGA